MAENVILTHKGVREMEKKLEYLKTVRRKEIAEQIKTARAFGDLSENAEYDEAKNEQAKIEGEIVQIENMLKNATVVDEEDVDLETVGVGTIVSLEDLDENEQIEYHIVGSAEADVFEGRISNESPVGRALIGKKAGDRVDVETPGGLACYRILGIRK